MVHGLPKKVLLFGQFAECEKRHVYGVAGSGVASPKKVGGPNNFFLLVSSKTLQYTCMGHPPYINIFQRICANLRRGLNRSGGPDPPIPPVATPLVAVAGCKVKRETKT